MSIVLTCIGLLVFLQGDLVKNRVQQPGASRAPVAEEVATLKFSEFFEDSRGELKPSRRLLSFSGRRVRITGFMAETEESVKGAFYLCPRRVYADESGGGTADLPVETVLVIVNSAKDRKISYVPNPIEVVGLLEVVEPGLEAAHWSRIRLILDEPKIQRPAGQLKRHN